MEAAIRELVERVRGARGALAIEGHLSKAFYGEAARGEPLSTCGLSGITSYEPSELVVTAGAGTPLIDLEAVLAEQGQCLAFEPPRFEGRGAGRGTVGGMVAAGLAGPARAAVGGVRDFVLGATMVNGRGELLTFGGQVMKNVAGYDVSRLLAGSMGMLGVICAVSLKVLPMPAARTTLLFGMDERDALRRLNDWAGMPLPLHASAWREGRLHVRLAGAWAAVDAAARRLGGERLDDAQGDALWLGLRDHSSAFHARALAAVDRGLAWWRLSVPSTTAPLGLAGESLIEHGGAQRWLVSDLPAVQVRAAVERVGGHATLFRALDKSAGVYTPLRAPLDRVHRELKQAFDPSGRFNPGRMFPGL
ncbi:MAG: glycolate oxidase subunit GlcE [Proteobacteria bacterium]|nr:glycolate oxidase subunit GlcE [Pseudomonadota bacterium]